MDAVASRGREPSVAVVDARATVWGGEFGTAASRGRAPQMLSVTRAAPSPEPNIENSLNITPGSTLCVYVWSKVRKSRGAGENWGRKPDRLRYPLPQHFLVKVANNPLARLGDSLKPTVSVIVGIFARRLCHEYREIVGKDESKIHVRNLIIMFPDKSRASHLTAYTSASQVFGWQNVAH